MSKLDKIPEAVRDLKTYGEAAFMQKKSDERLCENAAFYFCLSKFDRLLHPFVIYCVLANDEA